MSKGRDVTLTAEEVSVIRCMIWGEWNNPERHFALGFVRDDEVFSDKHRAAGRRLAEKLETQEDDE